MTLKEAVGVTSCHVDIKTGKELPHDEFYGRVVELLGGAEKVGEYIPVPLDEIRGMPRSRMDGIPCRHVP